MRWTLVLDPEVPASTVFAVVNYLRLLAPPAPGATTAARELGSTLFTSVGCASCHVPELHTGTAIVPALANSSVALYSDLLLHDMGDALADHRPDGQASWARVAHDAALGTPPHSAVPER